MKHTSTINLDKYAPTIRDRLMNIRHGQIILDPFPEHTEYQQTLHMISAIQKFFGLSSLPRKPEDISIWKAYMMGYDRAYKEIEIGLK